MNNRREFISLLGGAARGLEPGGPVRRAFWLAAMMTAPSARAKNVRPRKLGWPDNGSGRAIPAKTARQWAPGGGRTITSLVSRQCSRFCGLDESRRGREDRSA
jgi:hypothetical protein